MNKVILAVLISSILTQGVYAAELNNDVDCSDEDVMAYMDKSNYKKPAGYNTAPSFEEYQKPYIGLQGVEKGAEAANDCLTIFNGGVDFGKMQEKGNGVLDDISGVLSDPGGSLSKISGQLKDRAFEMYGKTKGTITKSVCERVESTAKSAGNQGGGLITGEINGITGQVKNSTVGSMITTGKVNNTSSVLRGTDNTSDNLFYKILENQVGKSESSISKLLNMTNIDVSKTGTKIVNSQLDSLEKLIFGK